MYLCAPDKTNGNLGRFDKYMVDLKGMQAGSCEYGFVLDNSFFVDIDGSEVQRGKVNVGLVVRKVSHAFELSFHTEGVVWVPCDRCLDDMEQHISSEDVLWVKFGNGYAEEDDNIIVIPEEEEGINVAWFMYEFVVLSVPMKHVHAPGKCNKAMSTMLHQHLSVLSSEENIDEDGSLEMEENTMSLEHPVDPRWNELRKILDNN